MDGWIAALPALAFPVTALAWLTLTPQRDILETHETRARIGVGNTIAPLAQSLRPDKQIAQLAELVDHMAEVVFGGITPLRDLRLGHVAAHVHATEHQNSHR